MAGHQLYSANSALQNHQPSSPARNMPTFLPLNHHLIILISTTTLILLAITILRLYAILSRRPPPPSSPRPSALHSPSSSFSSKPTHILIVLGSGGHTAEMLNMLSQQPRLQLDYTYRTYVISSGDTFSALKAHEFEKSLLDNLQSFKAESEGEGEDKAIPNPKVIETNYDVVTVHRARKVHQGLLTSPISSLWCILDCFAVLRGTHREFRPQRRIGAPDLILTNGPATGVIVVLASIILRFFGFDKRSAVVSAGRGADTDTTTDTTTDWTSTPVQQRVSFAQHGQMRTIFIESWARVKTLSLSGRMLKPLVDRFIVQWPQLVEKEGPRVEYIGPLVT